jgi:peptidoglycan/LPS O-acetylase OafA/YrhL
VTSSVSAAPAKAAALHIPSLDGLRAVSFLIVFIAHANVNAIPGGFGVTVFFFLSGFLITTLMRREMEQTGQVSFKGFYLRRALRILPPFYLVLTVGTLLTGLRLIPGNELHFWPVAAQYLHFSNLYLAFAHWGNTAPGTSVYWSLAIEEHFYLLFPMLFVGLHKAQIRGRAMAFWLWGLCLAILIWRCVLVFHFHVNEDRTYLSTDTRADAMLFGCALAVWHNPVLDTGGRPLSNAVRFGLFPAALVTLLASFVIRSVEFRESLRYSLQSLALTPVFVVAIRDAQHFAFRWLNGKLVRRMGGLSYSLYLVHHTVLEVAQEWFPSWRPWLVIAVCLPFCVLLAELIFRFVEKPSAELRKRLL